MADLGELVLTLRLDDAQYRRDLGESRRLAEQFGRAFGGTQKLGGVDTSRASRDINKFGANAETIITGAFLRIGSQITNILTNAIGTLASIPGQAVGSFLEYETGLNSLAVVTNSTREELTGVTNEVRRLGIETSKAPADVIAAANSLATLGFKAEQIEDALASVVSLSEATGTEVTLSADLIAKAGTVFGTSFEDAADAITILRNNSAALPQDVAFLLQNTGQAAAAVGLSFEETAAAFATLRDVGQQAEPAATGLRNVLLNLSPTADSAKEALDRLNLSVIDSATGEFAGFDELLTQLQASKDQFIASGQGVEAFNQNLRVLFGVEGLAAIQGLLSQVDGALLKNQQALRNTGGAAEESAGKLLVGFAGALELLKGTVDTLLISFGEGLAPVLQAFVQILTEVGNAILTSEGIFQPLIDAANTLRDALIGNPELVENLAKAVVNLIASGIDRVAQFLLELANNPEAIANSFNRTIESINLFSQAILGTLEVLDVLIRIGAAVANITSRGEEISRIPPIIRFLITPLQILNGIVGTLGVLFDRATSSIQGAATALRDYASITISPNLLAGRVGQGIGNFISELIPRKTGGPVGPGGNYLVGEAGPELGFFSGKAALFSGPTILPSPPAGQIFKASDTRRMLNIKSPNGGIANNQSNLVSEVSKLRSQVGQIKDAVPLLATIAQATAKNLNPSELQEEMLWQFSRQKLREAGF